MRILIKEPGKTARSIVIPSHDLGVLQELVGGYIETVTISPDLVVICNEEGRLLGLDYNCEFEGIDFVGTILFAGVKDDDFADIPDDLARAVMRDLWGR